MDTPETNPEKRKPNLFGIQSLPDCKFTTPKVEEVHTFRLEHRVTPDTFITTVQAGQMAVEEAIKHPYPSA